MVFLEYLLDLIRLNDQYIDDGQEILKYIKNNVSNCPTWIESWFTKNNVHILT